MEEKVKILYVDDELHNRNALYANFRRDYQIYLCSSGAEGLEKLHEIPEIPIVITDQKMPEMTGIEFLNLIEGKTAPIRIVVTAHRDMSILDMAKRNCVIYDYYDKPWNIEALKSIIDNAIKILREIKHGKVTVIKNLDFDVTRASIEQLVEKRNQLAIGLRVPESLIGFDEDSIKIEIQKLDKEIDKRGTKGQ